MQCVICVRVCLCRCACECAIWDAPPSSERAVWPLRRFQQRAQEWKGCPSSFFSLSVYLQRLSVIKRSRGRGHFSVCVFKFGSIQRNCLHLKQTCSVPPHERSQNKDRRCRKHLISNRWHVWMLYSGDNESALGMSKISFSLRRIWLLVSLAGCRNSDRKKSDGENEKEQKRKGGHGVFSWSMFAWGQASDPAHC